MFHSNLILRFTTFDRELLPLGFMAYEVIQYHNHSTRGIVRMVTIYLYYRVRRACGGSWELKIKYLYPNGFSICISWRYFHLYYPRNMGRGAAFNSCNRSI
ncbi:hypothetical protein CEXT_485861 [Caerostris extrusa]|uniref:Uncharacterized protein n=1 Tax=Caerostris extrusa TaxID=172846 RepID=A0AAV4R2F3_CAEEX|nr:hypothetical protein CEXT_485861 [Caerostris extrusa]